MPETFGRVVFDKIHSDFVISKFHIGPLFAHCLGRQLAISTHQIFGSLWALAFIHCKGYVSAIIKKVDHCLTILGMNLLKRFIEATVLFRHQFLQSWKSIKCWLKVVLNHHYPASYFLLQVGFDQFVSGIKERRHVEEHHPVYSDWKRLLVIFCFQPGISWLEHCPRLSHTESCIVKNHTYSSDLNSGIVE
uniref:Retinaldehyde-binding protein 1 n=1 Tax=Schistocephalus solidus TaxID=70667 RepID=A0A0X3PUQ5_SCHSO